jgi:putative membrane protein
MHMMNAEDFLDHTGRRAVEDATAAAEECTSAEIVCAVATESGRYDRAEAIVGVLAALLGLGVVHWITPVRFATSGSWAMEAAGAGWLALGVVLGTIAGTLLASYWHPLRRLFVADAEMETDVARAALAVFAIARLAATRTRAGVLIYVSLFERRVQIIADSRAMEVLGQAGVDAIRDIAVARLRDGNRAGTFVDAIVAAARALAPALPPEPANPDELPNRLRVFHPRP